MHVILNDLRNFAYPQGFRMNSFLRLQTLFTWCFLLIVCIGFAQNSPRTKYFSFNKDTICVDSLSIIPGTIHLQNKQGVIIDSSTYKINYVNATLITKIPNQMLQGDTFLITYKVFPFLFSEKYKHKDVGRIQNNQIGEVYAFSYEKNKDVDFFKMDGLTKSGSISRGISFGNNQDVVLNSNLNLQLAGKLSNNMDILLAATDQNIPIQPEGNTQQLQEFDKVFIQIGIKDVPTGGKTTVTAGDFVATKPSGYFMNFNKKLQGLSLESVFLKKHSQVLTAKASAAISKGKFAKNISIENANGNTFNDRSQERNQGPYKLRGAENELYIIVLAGTESVYLDGKLLSRGQENDYVIDYNTAEMTFTPKHLINKNSRIAVEFQYSDKNYSRSLVYAGSEYKNKRVAARINVYSEQDNKNKPLQQQLTNPQKLILSNIGDSIQNALWPTGDSIPFNSTEILYAKKDSGIGSYKFPIYKYSTDSSKAHFRLNFSYVGSNKGNYNILQSAANGKVYQWILPDTITGTAKGSYEPIILLTTPKQKQMINAGTDFSISENTKLFIEGAVSNYNVNTFSTIGKNDDVGLAGTLRFENLLPLESSLLMTGMDSMKKNSIWSLVSTINYEYTQKNFSPIERYRSVEFDRDWNRTSYTQKDDQHMMNAKIGFVKKVNSLIYNYSSFLEGLYYRGNKHALHVTTQFRDLFFNFDGSILNSKGNLNNSDFLRNSSSLTKQFNLPQSNKLHVGIKEQAEKNLFRATHVDSLISGSILFYEWEPFIEFQDSLKNKYSISYKQRTDYALKSPSTPFLNKSSFAENYGGSIDLFHNPKNQFRITGSYRRLQIIDSAITTQKPEQTVVGRIEYNIRIIKGLLTLNSLYEIGSGLEVKREFMFIEVAYGKGQYIWTDYNNDGIKQLNEFEISPFPNEANYIKVWVPTNDYINTYSNQFSEVFSIRPTYVWGSKQGFRKFISRFSNQTAYRTDRKTTNSNLGIAYNPFWDDTKDNTLIALNSSLINTTSFNQTDPVFGADFSWQDMRNKSLMVNDTSYRITQLREFKIRWNMNTQWTLQNALRNGVKQNDSRFFNSKNYNITSFESESMLSYLPSTSFQITASYKLSLKKNILSVGITPNEKSQAQNFGAEFRFNALNKGSLAVKTNLIDIVYNASENTPTAFEMLDGLHTGKNYTWNISYNRMIANAIQLGLTYDGRQSPGVKIIHTGSAQVKAYF